MQDEIHVILKQKCSLQDYRQGELPNTKMQKVQAPGNRGGLKLQATHNQSVGKYETNENPGIKNKTALKTTTFTKASIQLEKSMPYVCSQSFKQSFT